MACSILIIGGGSGAGKSTLANQISENYGYKHYKIDDYTDELQKLASKQKLPINSRINSLPRTQQPLEILKLSADDEMSRQRELFLIFSNEFKPSTDIKIILDGNFFFPDLMNQYLDFEYRAIWIIPTLAYQYYIYPRRSWLPKILSSSEDRENIIRNWINRDKIYNEYLIQQLKDNGIEYILIDNLYDHKNVISKAINRLGL